MFAKGAFAYEWSPIIGLDNPFSNAPMVYLSRPIQKPTIYNYTVIGTDLKGCIDSAKVNVLINNLPQVDAGKDTGICLGKSLVLKAVGAKFYIWENTPSIRPLNKDTARVTPSLTSTYRFTGIDSYQCKNYDSVKVTVFVAPIANAGKDDTICNGRTYLLNGSGGGNYFWSGTEPVSQLNIAKPLTTPKKNSTFVLRVTDNNGCIDFDTVSISVLGNPTPQIFGKTFVCKNEHETKFNTTETKNAFHWQIIGGTINSGQGMSSIVAQWNSTDTAGKLMVTEALKIYPFCSTTDEHIVKIGGSIAPTPPNIVLKANALETQTLICPKCNFENYQWGYESKKTRTEINTCKNIIWCTFPGIDTVNNYYWVKVGGDLNCQTKAYFNSPLILSNDLKMESERIKLFPNPVYSEMFVESETQIREVEVFDNLGRLITTYQYTSKTENKFRIDFSSRPKGVYIIHIVDAFGSYYKKIIKE
jgi:hypothetical protein